MPSGEFSWYLVIFVGCHSCPMVCIRFRYFLILSVKTWWFFLLFDDIRTFSLISDIAGIWHEIWNLTWNLVKSLFLQYFIGFPVRPPRLEFDMSPNKIDVFLQHFIGFQFVPLMIFRGTVFFWIGQMPSPAPEYSWPGVRWGYGFSIIFFEVFGIAFLKACVALFK